MANPLADLVARLDGLPPHLGEIADDIRRAIAIAAITPDMSLTLARKILEEILRDLFQTRVGKPPGTRSLDKMLEDLKGSEHLPRKLAIYAHGVREFGNLGAHFKEKSISEFDVAQSIGQLLVIVEWYDSSSVRENGPPIDNSKRSPSDRQRFAAMQGVEENPAPTRPAGAEVTLPRLRPLLGGIFVPMVELLGLYRRCAPAGWEQPPPAHEPVPILSRCIESLGRAPRQGKDGLFPLHRFVRYLCDRVDDKATTDALNGWLDASMSELCVDRDEALRMRTALEGSGSKESVEESDEPGPACYLLVQVSPRLYEAGRYGVKAWLFGTGEPACLLAGEEGMPLDQVQACLDELRVELFRRGDESGRAWVELLLPRELLCGDVDQWRVEEDFLEAIPLGVHHRLVVRSLERASRPKLAMAHQSRGKVLGRRLHDRCRLCEWEDGDALWIDENQPGGSGLLTTLSDAQGVVGAALGIAPHPRPREPAADVLDTLMAAGLPIVLWSRRPAGRESGATRVALLDLLVGGPLGRLPDRVWELRKEAIRSEDAGHIGRHLSLLWDDPSRTSPDFEANHRLRAPSREA